MFVSRIFYAHSNLTSANRVNEGLIFPATVLFENNGVRKSPICSRRGIQREIRYRAAQDFFPQTRNSRGIAADAVAFLRNYCLPVTLGPSVADAGCARQCLEIGIVEKCDDRKERNASSLTTRNGGTEKSRRSCESFNGQRNLD